MGYGTLDRNRMRISVVKLRHSWKESQVKYRPIRYSEIRTQPEMGSVRLSCQKHTQCRYGFSTRRSLMTYVSEKNICCIYSDPEKETIGYCIKLSLVTRQAHLSYLMFTKTPPVYKKKKKRTPLIGRYGHMIGQALGILIGEEETKLLQHFHSSLNFLKFYQKLKELRLKEQINFKMCITLHDYEKYSYIYDVIVL